jgi:hypothetical protein
MPIQELLNRVGQRIDLIVEPSQIVTARYIAKAVRDRLGNRAKVGLDQQLAPASTLLRAKQSCGHEVINTSV